MTIFILTLEPYHDNSTVVGAYPSIESAKDAAAELGIERSSWLTDGFYVDQDKRVSDRPGRSLTDRIAATSGSVLSLLIRTLPSQPASSPRRTPVASVAA